MSLETTHTLPGELESELDFQLQSFSYKPTDVIVLQYKMNTIPMEDLRTLFHYVRDAFPDNKVIAFPSDASLSSYEKESLIKCLSE